MQGHPALVSGARWTFLPGKMPYFSLKTDFRSSQMKFERVWEAHKHLERDSYRASIEVQKGDTAAPFAPWELL